MKRRRTGMIGVSTLLIGVLWVVWIRELPVLQEPETKLPSPRVRTHVAEKNKKTSLRSKENYDFSPIQAEIQKNRLQLATCFLRNQNASSKQYKLILTWESQGLLKTVQLIPDAGEEVRNCIEEIARKWEAKPHPALQPFSYTVVLLPSAL